MKLHFLFSNGSKFSSLEIERDGVIPYVQSLTQFVTTNEEHVKEHAKCYASTSKVKFPLSRGFFVGLEREAGKIETLITPESKAIKYRGKSLLLESLASEIEHRINVINDVAPFVGTSVNFTPQMRAALEAEQIAKEAAKERKMQKAIAQVSECIEGSEVETVKV